MNPTEPSGCGRPQGEFVENIPVDLNVDVELYADVLARLDINRRRVTSCNSDLVEDLLPSQGQLTATDMCLFYGRVWLRFRGRGTGSGGSLD